MIRFIRDCVIPMVTYINVGIELLCPTLGTALHGDDFDKHDDEESV